MFSGLVQELGTVERIDQGEQGVRLRVAAALARELGQGDSIAVNGICLTAASVEDGHFGADVMNTTLGRTSLASIGPGAGVNLELPLRASDRLGGHIVQGHVDGVGEVVAVSQDGFSRRLSIAPPPELMRYLVEKGSIAVDGVSLTVAEVDDRSFTVSLIPETLERTNLGVAEFGTRVNLEVDILAKYVEKAVHR